MKFKILTSVVPFPFTLVSVVGVAGGDFEIFFSFGGGTFFGFAEVFGLGFLFNHVCSKH